jgi:VIT1/CCC1 family predicted Fe2+/Mn2+ transporter
MRAMSGPRLPRTFGGINEPHTASVGGRVNWLRAGVLGANAGIVSTASLVVGVAGATSDRGALVTAGIAGLFAGALSMAVGEYVSVSTQRDTERALLDKERCELAEDPHGELSELASMYEAKGLSASVAEQVALELTAHDALGAHAEVELHMDPEELTSPWQAGGASFVAFTVGALLPLLAIVLSPAGARVAITFGAVLAGLALTGSLSAQLGGARRGPAVRRVMFGGALAMAITYAIGLLVGSTNLAS